jgi:hypothetical protein
LGGKSGGKERNALDVSTSWRHVRGRNLRASELVTTEAEQEQRAREIADTTRRYLTALNTGGIALTFAVAGALASEGVQPGWAVRPVAVFVLGLTITGGSLFFAKHKTFRRRNAARAGAPEPDFAKWYSANFTYELLALITFLVAVIVGLWELSHLQLPTQVG